MIAKSGGKAPAQYQISSDNRSTELLQPCFNSLERCARRNSDISDEQAALRRGADPAAAGDLGDRDLQWPPCPTKARLGAHLLVQLRLQSTERHNDIGRCANRITSRALAAHVYGPAIDLKMIS